MSDKCYSLKKYPTFFLRTLAIFTSVSIDGKDAPVSYREKMWYYLFYRHTCPSRYVKEIDSPGSCSQICK